MIKILALKIKINKQRNKKIKALIKQKIGIATYDNYLLVEAVFAEDTLRYGNAS